MSGGLVALLDDIAAIAKAAAASVDDVAAASMKASAKAAGVVVDDTAVTPRYVTGVTPDRELPIIWKITKGSLLNKLIIILPIIMLLSQYADWALTPILMVGGAFLSYEGAHKIWGALTGHGHEDTDHAAVEEGPEAEKKLTAGAIRTDLILSAEIMVISLNEVAAESFWNRLAILIVVAIFITVVVYGFVAILVKMDDIGLRLSKRPATAALGRGLVKAMPKVLNVISIVGVAAMLWVGGHILLVGAQELGWPAPYDLVHHLETAVGAAVAVPVLGPTLAWLTNTLGSAIAGFLVGSVIVGILALLPFGKRGHGDAAAHDGDGELDAEEAEAARVRIAAEEDAEAEAGIRELDREEDAVSGDGATALDLEAERSDESR